MRIDRNAEGRSCFGIKAVELCHDGDLILRRDALPVGYQIRGSRIAEQTVNRVVRAGNLERDVQPVFLRDKTQDVVFKHFSHFLHLFQYGRVIAGAVATKVMPFSAVFAAVSTAGEILSS